MSENHGERYQTRQTPMNEGDAIRNAKPQGKVQRFMVTNDVGAKYRIVSRLPECAKMGLRQGSRI